ncbi:MAG: insulinase family protein [Melioribacteraceae bacterium]|nr:insulinase family protein [Melioribacteraceae bacterium]
MIDRSVKPIETPELSFALPKIDQLGLTTDVKSYFVSRDDLPIVKLNLIIKAGSNNDPLGKKGLAHLTSSLIDEGAGEFNSLELSDQFELLGSTFNITVDNDSILFSILSLKENFEKTVALLSLIINEPLFSNEDFNREKNNVLTKVLQFKDNADYLADSSFQKLIFEDSPYSFPSFGLRNTLESITLDDVKSFYNDFIFTNICGISAVGDISKSELERILVKYFPNNLAAQTKELEIKFNSESKNRIFLIEKKDAQQTEIRVGHLTNSRHDNDYFSKLVLNTILGGQFSSRINHNLREVNGFTYGANSSFSYNKINGMFLVSTTVDSQNTSAALKEILFELRDIKNGVSTEELNFAKSYLRKRFPSQFETYSKIVSILTSLIVSDRELDYLHNYEDMLSDVNKTSALKAAAERINNDNLTIVLAGNVEEIKKQLSDFEGFTTIDFEVEGAVI